MQQHQDDPEELGRRHHLGAIKDVWRTRAALKASCFKGSVATFIVTALSVSAIGRRDLYRVTGVLLILIVLWTYIAWDYYHNRRGQDRMLIVYENGLIYIKPSLSIEIIPWHRIKEIQLWKVEYSGEGGDDYYYTITRTGGRELTFNNDYFARRSGLRKAIEAGVVDRKWPVMLQAYQQGKTINFGALAVTQQGLDLSHVRGWPSNLDSRGTVPSL